MEYQPAIPEELHEPAQVDLLENMAQVEVTMFGITATIGKLAEMCPIDLSDPRVSLEAKNTFVVKAVNESGSEIEPQLAETFNTISTKLGLERKYSIREQAPEPAKIQPAVEQKQPAAEVTTESSTKAEPTRNIQTEIHTASNSAEIEPSNTIAVATPPEILQLALRENFTEQISLDASTVPTPAPVNSHGRVEHIPATMVQQEGVMHDSANAIPVELHQHTSVDIPLEKDTSHASLEQSDLVYAEQPEQTEVEVVEVPFDWFDTSLELPSVPRDIVEHTETLEGTTQTPAEVWQSELIKSPAERVESFVSALEYFAEMHHEATDNEDDVSAPEQYDSTLSEFLQLIATKISSAEITDAEPIEQHIGTIMGLVHGAHTLEISAAGDATYADIKTRLYELTASLLRHLDIPVDEHTIRSFVEIMLDPTFTPPPAEKQLLDLEKQGTHEIKFGMAALIHHAQDVSKHAVQQVLGGLALSAGNDLTPAA